MKTLRTLVFVLFAAALLAPQQADAQIWKRLKDRAEDRVKERLEEKAEEKVDEAVDRAVDRAWSAAEASVADAAAGAVSGMGNVFSGVGMPENEIAPLGPNAAAPAGAPYVRYVSTSRLDMGALGALTRLMGKDLLTTQETVTLSRSFQRTDQQKTSTLVDVEGQRFVTLNHEDKTYSETTFEQLAAMMQSYSQQADEAADEAANDAGTDADAEQADVEYRFDLRTERTGRREDVNGTPAEQTIVIIETEAEAEQDGQTTEGTFFTVMDLWTAETLAGIETMRAFQQALAESLGKQMQENASAAFGRMGQDPRLGPAMAKASAEMQKVTGLAVRSTMHFIVAPAGAELDLEAALAPPEEGEAAPAPNAEASEDGTVSRQTTMLRVTTQISDAQPLDGPGDAFTIPAGYMPATTE